MLVVSVAVSLVLLVASFCTKDLSYVTVSTMIGVKLLCRQSGYDLDLLLFVRYQFTKVRI